MSDLSYQGQIIQQRDSDNYVNATQMGKVNNVLINDFNRSEFAKQYLKALQESICANSAFIVEGFGADKTTWFHPLYAIAFAQWISPKFHVWCNVHVKILIETGKTKLVENLEKQFLPKVSLKEIDEFAVIMGKRFGAAYEQRLLTQNIKKFHPHLLITDINPEEKASLTTEALLTPTQIASELGFKYSTGNPDPRKVNKLLEDLGYQTKVGGIWSATDKAKGLCDRKPVDTNSRSQKDQLMWSAKIIDILKEYVIN